jgi:hypothetical protein
MGRVVGEAQHRVESVAQEVMDPHLGPPGLQHFERTTTEPQPQAALTGSAVDEEDSTRRVGWLAHGIWPTG